MLMRGTPPTMRSPPHQSRPTENPPNLQPATVGEEERGGRDPTSRRTSMRAASDCRPPPTARHASQPRTAPATPPPPQSTAAPLHGEGGQRRRRTAAPRHTAGCGPRPCSASADPRPATAAPHDTSPANNNKAGGKEDILSSATGPSTARCSKDVTTHQHRPGARPGRPCPVPACGGQPLPGERRFSSALGNRVFSPDSAWVCSSVVCNWRVSELDIQDRSRHVRSHRCARAVIYALPASSETTRYSHDPAHAILPCACACASRTQVRVCWRC